MHSGLCLTLQNAANEAFKDLLSDESLEHRLESARYQFAHKDGINLETASPETKQAVTRLIDRDFNGILEQRDLTKKVIESVLKDKFFNDASPAFLIKGPISG